MIVHERVPIVQKAQRDLNEFLGTLMLALTPAEAFLVLSQEIQNLASFLIHEERKPKKIPDGPVNRG